MNAITSKRSWPGNMEETRDIVSDGKSVKEKTGGSRENSKSRKKSKPSNKNDSDTKTCLPKKPKKPMELETNPLVLQRRQKQIDYGKNTVGYHNYICHVKIDERTKKDPRTPDKYTKYSRRSWDTLIKKWRKKLHEYDTDATGSGGGDDNDEVVDADDSDRLE